MDRNINLAIRRLANEAGRLEQEADVLAKKAKRMRETVVAMHRLVPRSKHARPAFGRGRIKAKRTGASAAAADVLKRSGGAMRVNEILARLSKRGVTVGGKRPYATLAATLTHRKDVERVAVGLWTAKKTPGPGPMAFNRPTAEQIAGLRADAEKSAPIR